MAGRLSLNYWVSRLRRTGRAADYLVFTVQAVPAFSQRAYYVSGNTIELYASFFIALLVYLPNPNTQG